MFGGMGHSKALEAGQESTASACGKPGSVSEDVGCQLDGLVARWTQPPFPPPARATRESQPSGRPLCFHERGCE